MLSFDAMRPPARGICKQERFSPVPIVFEMAWLVAFNDGLFDDVKPQQIPGLLERLNEYIADTSPGLDMERSRFSELVRVFMGIQKS